MNVFLRDTEIRDLEKLIWPESIKNKLHTEGNYNKTHTHTKKLSLVTKIMSNKKNTPTWQYLFSLVATYLRNL